MRVEGQDILIRCDVDSFVSKVTLQLLSVFHNEALTEAGSDLHGLVRSTSC